ncbi:MAG: Rrf2 family transcriptional regulator [Bacteroides sp. SM1_62]|nr:MAG: Rrf2 family transcriptional regulator [Bacteroides sp. SM23_62]KPL23091.1 MAG: Rrf2 family transcriptional regulator [Bacteroides sp. SM1_62]
MKFNTKTRYGLRTMIELAVQGTERGVYQKEISERQEISFKYLDQIIASLKASGLIVNSEGRMSGYILAKDPEKISVYDIYKAFEHELMIIECLKGEGKCSRERLCAAREFWNGLNDIIINYLESTSLIELAIKQEEINEGEAASMFYI